MRKLLIGLAMSSTALASPALAREDAWYVELDGGLAIVNDMQYDLDDVGGTAGNPLGGRDNLDDIFQVDHDLGYDIGGIVGYDFGGFRVEGEVSYRQAGVDEI